MEWVYKIWEEATSGFWMFMAFWIVFALVLQFIYKMTVGLLEIIIPESVRVRKLRKENEQLIKRIDELEGVETVEYTEP